MVEFETGKLHQGLTYEEYVLMPGWRASDLKLFKRSPAHWKAAQTEPQKKSDAMRLGTLFHELLQHGEGHITNFREEPQVDKRTKIGKETLEEFRDSLEDGQIPVSQDEMRNLTGMFQSVLNYKILKNLIRDGMREVSGSIIDPETGLPLKFRADFISARGFMCDFKTTRDARNPFFYNQIFSDNFNSPFYILSAAHYVHCANMLKACKSESMTLIAVENEKPWGIKLWPLDIGCLDVGERWRKQITKQIAECVAKDQWPGYEERAEPVIPPQWAKVPDEEDDLDWMEDWRKK